jgi:hypothetical protein
MNPLYYMSCHLRSYQQHSYSWTINSFISNSNTAASQIVEAVTLMFSECLTQSSWHSVCMLCHLRPSKQYTYKLIPSPIATPQLPKSYCLLTSLRTHITVCIDSLLGNGRGISKYTTAVIERRFEDKCSHDNNELLQRGAVFSARPVPRRYKQDKYRV